MAEDSPTFQKPPEVPIVDLDTEDGLKAIIKDSKIVGPPVMEVKPSENGAIKPDLSDEELEESVTSKKFVDLGLPPPPKVDDGNAKENTPPHPPVVAKEERKTILELLREKWQRIKYIPPEVRNLNQGMQDSVADDEGQKAA